MRARIVKPLFFSVFFLSLSPLAFCEKGLIKHHKIIASTWSMQVSRVLGWQYDGPYWVKGNEEKGDVNEVAQIDPAKNVRSVCLGEEGDYYVFFTLRSFFDPLFPNPYIQKVNPEKILNKNGEAYSQKELDDESYIRYGSVSLVYYQDVGGGTFKIKTKANGITHCDRNNPKTYGRSIVNKWYPGRYEIIDDVKYEIPHENISAKTHLALQQADTWIVKYIGEHDVALLYVPKASFDEQKQIKTLGIENPTLSVRLMLEHNEELFGFKFVLVGQETLDIIKDYVPEQTETMGTGKGFYKLAGLALSSHSLNMIKRVDVALDKVIPDRLVEIKSRIEKQELAWDLFSTTAIKIIDDAETRSKIKDYLRNLY